MTPPGAAGRGRVPPADPLASLRFARQTDDAARLAYHAYPGVAAEPALVDRFLAQMDDPEFTRLWRLVAPHTVVDLFRVKRVYDWARESLDQPGDLVECGVAGGGVSLLLACLVREQGRAKTIHLCDSFAGLPAPDARQDRGYAAGEFATSAATVRALLQEHGVADRCVLHEGWFADTLPRLPAGTRFCFAHIDCDLYASAEDCLREIHPRMSPGCPVVFDDYNDGCYGVMAAVHEHLRRTNECLFLGPTAQAALRKGVTESGDPKAALRVALDPRGRLSRDAIPLTFSLERIVGDAAYAAFLRHVEGEWAERVERLGDFRRRLDVK